MTISNIELLLLNVFEWITLASLKSIPLILILLTLHHLFRKFISAAVRHFLWLTLSISLIIPFGWKVNLAALHTPAIAIKLSDPIANNSHSSILLSKNTTSVLNTANNDFASTIDANTLSGNILNIELYRLLALGWLAGVIILLALTLREVKRYHYIKNQSKPLSLTMATLFSECQVRMQLNKSITLLCSDKIHSPIAVGWIKPSIIIPTPLTHTLNNEQALYIFLHELGHIKRHDILFNWLVSLINIIHWFNPLVWLASHHIRTSMEVACDALVLTQLPKSQRTDYGATLIELSEMLAKQPRSITTVGILENHKELLERLTMIKKFTPIDIKKKILSSMVLLCIAVISFAQPTTTTSATDDIISTENYSASADPHSMTLQVFIEQAERLLKTDIYVGQQYAGHLIRIKTELTSLSHSKLLSQLKVNGFTAIKSADHIEIVRLDDVRYAAVPVVEKGKTYFNDEYVTEYVPLEKTCSMSLLPAIRPMVPQWSHIAMYTGSLLITDSYGNIQRIKATIRALEKDLECVDAPQSTNKK